MQKNLTTFPKNVSFIVDCMKKTTTMNHQDYLTIKYFLGKDGDEAASSAEPSNESPILNASFPSKLVFSWFTEFAWMGFKRSLGFADLYDLPPFVQSGNVVPRFLEKWNQNEIPKSSPKKSSTPPAVKVPT
jgi:hypothetical protein